MTPLFTDWSAFLMWVPLSLTDWSAFLMWVPLPLTDRDAFTSLYLRNRVYAHLEILLRLIFHLSTIYIVLFIIKKSLKFEVQKINEICHHSNLKNLLNFFRIYVIICIYLVNCCRQFLIIMLFSLRKNNFIVKINLHKQFCYLYV